MALLLTSRSFAPGAAIPSVHTCEGDDRSPALAFDGVPPGTKSLVLIVDDPDAPDPRAPRTIWVHWILYDLPPDCSGLPEGVGSDGLPEGTLEGRNDWKRTGWGGPCPPVGRHRYFFKLYALDRKLGDLHHPDKATLLAAMEKHVLERAELVGTYEKKHRR